MIDEKNWTNQDILVANPPASCVDHIHKLTICPEQYFDQNKGKKRCYNNKKDGAE